MNFRDFYLKEDNFIGVCDKIRCKKDKEDWWHNIMDNKVEISEEEFLKHVNPTEILDDEETWDEYSEAMKQEDPNAAFYKTGDVYFFQTTGFEYFWKDDKKLN
jgi:hypothetical protein